MKLIIAILHAKDAEACVTALNDAGFACTRLGSFGGFLERDNVTLLIGVEGPRWRPWSASCAAGPSAVTSACTPR